MKNEFSHLFTTSVFTFLSKSFLKKFWVAFLVSNSFEFVVLAMNERGGERKPDPFVEKL